jgi:pimeloyl-ACP methyl ester carboxylesterase
MPYAQAEGAKLYYEETGHGYPIVFVHEFGSDCREWETQVRFFSREYRCVTYNARGYPPSEVPEDEKLYGQEYAVNDVAAVMRHLGIQKAHVVGLSMGGFATLLFGIRYPQMASALVVAGAGSGAPKAEHAAFKASNQEKAKKLIAQGWKGELAEETGHSPTRIQLKKKDPRGWAEFMQHLEEHSALGTGLTMKHYQGGRDSIFDWEPQLKQMQVPTLLAVGDEDAPCIETNVFLKKVLPNAGLWIYPRTGHAINLEEPAAFNRACQDFFSTVERGRWTLG